MHMLTLALLGCLDYADLEGMLEEDGGKKGNHNGDRGDDDDDGSIGGEQGGRDDRDGDGGDGDGGDGVGGDGDGVNDGAGDVEDDTCALGVSAFCTCGEAYGYPCSNDDMMALYEQCLAGADQGLFECMADFVDGDTIDCYSSLSTCLAEYEG